MEFILSINRMEHNLKHCNISVLDKIYHYQCKLFVIKQSLIKNKIRS